MASRLEEALKLAFPERTGSEGPNWEAKKAWEWQHGQWLEKAGFLWQARKAYERAWQAGERDPDLKAAIERLGGDPKLAEWEKLAAERDRLMNESKFAEALDPAERVVEMLRAQRPGSLELALELFELGGASYSSGRLGEADRAWRESLAIIERLAPGSLDMARILNGLGVVAARRDDLAEAQRRFESALLLYEWLDPGSLNVARSLNNLGNVARAHNDLAEAQRRSEAALQIFKQFDPGSKDVAGILNSLGNVARSRNDLGEAQRRYEAAL